MAQQNLLVANEHLFARKGEATPAGGGTVSSFGQSCLSGVPQKGSKQQTLGKPKRQKRGASPLSSLIQRRPYSPPVAGDGGDAVVTEHSVFATWRQLRNRLETAQPSDRDTEWKKLTFRLPYDQYTRLKNLAGLWGSTYQGILEKAVSYYLDEATTSEDFKWKV
jgi:hypothetical protein